MKTAAQRQVKNIHSVLDCRIDRIQDVFAASVQHVSREDVVVPQPRARSDTGHVIDAHPVHNSSLAGYSRGIASGVRPVVLDCLGVEALLFSFVIKYLGHNNFF